MERIERTKPKDALMLNCTPSTDQMPYMTLCKLVLTQIYRFDPMQPKRLEDLVNLFCAGFG